MSDLSLIGGGSDERTEDESFVCLGCDALVAPLDLNVLVVEGGLIHIACHDDYVLASQRAMDREAVQG